MNLEKLFGALDHLPTTRIRVLVTIGLITATGATYLMHACDARVATTLACGPGWEPSLNWLIFLSALAGVDVTQYFAKSFTAVQQAKVQAVTQTTPTPSTSVENSTDGVTSTSDVSELNRESELKG